MVRQTPSSPDCGHLLWTAPYYFKKSETFIEFYALIVGIKT